jgi:hypothetical protein
LDRKIRVISNISPLHTPLCSKKKQQQHIHILPFSWMRLYSLCCDNIIQWYQTACKITLWLERSSKNAKWGQIYASRVDVGPQKLWKISSFSFVERRFCCCMHGNTKKSWLLLFDSCKCRIA